MTPFELPGHGSITPPPDVVSGPAGAGGKDKCRHWGDMDRMATLFAHFGNPSLLFTFYFAFDCGEIKCSECGEPVSFSDGLRLSAWHRFRKQFEQDIIESRSPEEKYRDCWERIFEEAARR